jgi:hypothetical protein
MARNQPDDVDLFFLAGAILIFLMINYNMPLSNIYMAMVILGAMMYLVPIQFNLFRWLPIVRPQGSFLMKVGIGALFGYGFIQLYQHYTQTPMAAIFATTLFGESEILTKIVYSGLIPPIETVFFFVTILSWWAWKIGDNVITLSPFSFDGIKLMIMFGAVFVLFHATAKGVENNVDLIMTFVFGAISIGMILFYKEAIQAIVMHMTVNGYAMNVFDAVKNFAAGTSTFVIAGVVFVLYLITKKKGLKVLS